MTARVHVDLCPVHDLPLEIGQDRCAECEQPEGARTPPEQETAH